ncbi:MAG TPA: recombination protein NinG [Paraburkholderia sp.]
MTLRASLKPRKCRQCKAIFTPARSMQAVCSPACAAEHAKKLAAQKAARANRAERKSIRAALEKAKTRGTHLKEAQVAVNAYVRLRDANKPCISCDRPATWGGQWHASHYRAVGSNPGWRFNLWNISKSCSICNAWKSGNLTEYRPRLIAKIGLERVEMLERESPVRKYDIEYLKRLKRIFRDKTKRLRKLQDRGMWKESNVPRATGLPDALLPVYEEWDV